MKRAGILLLLLLFLVSQSGMAISVHWCGGSVNSIHFTAKKYGCCCKKAMKPGCCKDYTILLKVKAKPVKTAQDIPQPQCVKAAPVFSAFAFLTVSPNAQRISLNLHPPEDPPGLPVFLRNRCLLV